MKNFLKYACFALVGILLLTILIHTSRELDQDLGRHIKLGEIILTTGTIPSTNLFSYTHPDFPFFNHHWGSEVIFYLVQKAGGIAAISYLKIVLLFGAVAAVLAAALKKAPWQYVLFTTAVSIPLLIPRTLDRPEMFGYFFFCMYIWILNRYYDAKNEPTKFIWLIPLIQLLWINLHITFIYGFVLLGIFGLQALINKDWRRVKLLFAVSAASLAASLVNPHGLTGLLYPLKIFEIYGYSIQENQNLFFLRSLTANIFIPYFWALFWPSTTTIGLHMIRYRVHFRQNLSFYLLFSVFTLLAILAIRNLPFFVFVLIFAFPYIAHALTERFEAQVHRGLPYAALAVCVLLIPLFYSNTLYRTFDIVREFGIGASEKYKASADFMLTNRLRGPIFNNFDMGGYLDYRLYPEYRVFVDNRPEAFPVAFFDEYKQAQSTPRDMKKLLEKYHIQTVIFSHTDATPWAMEFMKNLQEFTDYKLVYLDGGTFIMTHDSSLPVLEEKNFARLIENTPDYLDLYNLSTFFSYRKLSALSDRALEKSYEANPSSCAVRLNYAFLLVRSAHLPLQKQGVEILKGTGLCPYPPYVKKEVKKLTSLQ